MNNTQQSILTTQNLYTQVRADAIALNNTGVVVNHTGSILSNPNNVRRIDVVKEQIQTWYYLSECLLNTAFKSSLKPEFCAILQNAIQEYQKAPRKNQQNWSKKIERNQQIKSQNSSQLAENLMSEEPQQPKQVLVSPPQPSTQKAEEPVQPQEWKKVEKGIRGQPRIVKSVIPELNRYQVLADQSEDAILSNEEIKSFVSDLTSISSSKSTLLKSKAKVAEQRQVLELKKLEIQCAELEQKAALQQAQQELQLLEITERKEAITLRRMKQGIDEEVIVKNTLTNFKDRIISLSEHKQSLETAYKSTGFSEQKAAQYILLQGELEKDKRKLKDEFHAFVTNHQSIKESPAAQELQNAFQDTVLALADKSKEYAEKQIHQNSHRKALQFNASQPTMYLPSYESKEAQHEKLKQKADEQGCNIFQVK